MASAFIVLVCLLVVATSLEAARWIPSGLPGGFHNGATFKVNGPYIIAHRGENTVFPESSAPAFKRSIEEGADFIETDIGATKDGYLICLHDVTLDAITDVANRSEFRDRLATYEVEGTNTTGYFAVDFNLEEIKSLRLHQRFDFREQLYNGLYEISTFEEYIAIALDANRIVGIDPEIKNPVFINEHVKWENGKTFEDKFVEVLHKYGYKSKYMSNEWLQKPIFIQTFAPMSIFQIINQTSAPKIFNIGPPHVLVQGTNMTYAQLSTDEYLDYIGQFLLGISVDKSYIAPLDQDGRLLPTTNIVDRAHARGLQIHPATYRNENQFIPKAFKSDPYLELDFITRQVGVDAIFVDATSTGKSYMKAFEIGIAAKLWGSCLESGSG